MARKFKSKAEKFAWETGAKQELITLERQTQETEAFYKLTSKVAVRVVDANLSVTAYRLWIYLSSLYQFGDRFEYMPTQAELAARLGVSRRSIIRAVAELENASLWEFRIERWRGRNCTGFGANNNVTPSDSNGTKGDNFVTPFAKNGTKGDTAGSVHNIDRVRAKTISDLDQTLSDKSECAKNDLQNQPEEEPIHDSSEKLVEGAITQTTIDCSKRSLAALRDPFFNRKPSPRDIEWDWLPNGPWRTENGKLDAQFQTAIAQRWLKAHGGDLHEKRANVLKHFKNDPTNLPIEWEWYQNLILHKAGNIQIRKEAGINTTEEEQEIIKHSSAGRELPEELRVSEERSPQEVLQEVAPHTLKAMEAPRDENGQINPAAYERKESAQEDVDYWQKIYSNLQASQEKRKGMKKLTALREVVQPPAETPFAVILADMRKYLNSGSDTYRQIAIDWALDPANQCQVIRDATGWIVDIQEIDF